MSRRLLLNNKEIAAAKKAFLTAPKSIQRQVRIYNICAYPDLTEGRMGPTPAGLVALRIDEDSNLVRPGDYIEDYLHAHFGPRVEHVQSVAPIPGWFYKKAKDPKLIFDLIEPQKSKDESSYDLSDEWKLLMVIEGIRVPNPIWSEYDFYKKMGMRR